MARKENMMSFTDLVIKCQSGDVQAYGELVERFQGMAFGYVYFLLGDFHLAQDARQEAFLEGLYFPHIKGLTCFVIRFVS